MSEPVMRRTRPIVPAPSVHTSASSPRARLALALSLFGAMTLTCLGVSANSDPAPATVAPAVNAADWSTVSGKSIHSLLLDISHAGKRLVVVGDRGHILYSDDQGLTWVQAKVPSRQLLTAVFFVDDQHGWAVGHDAQILASTDGGATWVKQFEDIKREAPLLGIWFKDPSNGIAVGAYGMLLATTDGGQHWDDASARIDNPDGYHLNAIGAVKDSGLFIVGEMGSMFRSADWGQTWQKIPGPYQGSLFGVLGTAQPGVVLAYGLRGNLFRSGDFGTTWETIKPKTDRGSLDYGLFGGALLGDGSLVIVGNGGSVLKSTDDGKSFSVFNRPDRVALSAVGTEQNGNLILVGEDGAHATSSTGADTAHQ